MSAGALNGAAEERRVHRKVAHLMEMPISLALRGRHAGTSTGQEAWAAAIEQLRNVDRAFSTYRDDSVISRLDRGEIDLADCPSAVAEVLALGAEAERQSAGAFSIYLPDENGVVRLDPSGVVKGWAIERASELFCGLADTDFCLSAGGDMVCHTSGPDSPAWRIGIEHPDDPRKVIAVVPVRNGAVATSGTAHRGQHLVDARTGLPPRGVASVTVIGPSLTWADIDATAAYASGAAAAAEWLRGRAGRTGLVVWPNATTTTVVGRRAG